jgi:ATP-binding cassette subfamily B protein
LSPDKPDTAEPAPAPPRDWLSALVDRFPALGDLRAQLGRKRIPFQLGITMEECAVACLTMVLGYFGRRMTLQEVRQTLDAHQGTNAEEVLKAARELGLEGRAVSLSAEDFGLLDPATILHWDFSHMVVFERTAGSRVVVLDPSAGRREIPLAEVKKHFTGVALIFEPGANFRKVRGSESHFRRFLWDVLKDFSLASRIFLTSLLLEVLSLGLPLLTSVVVDQIIPRSDDRLLWLVGLGLGGVTAAYFVAVVIRGLLVIFWQARLDARLSTALMSRLVRLPYAFFQSRAGAEVAFRLQSVNALRDGLTSNLIFGILDGTMVVSYGLLILWMSPSMGALVFALAAVQVGIFFFYSRREQLAGAEEVVKASYAHTVASELVDAIEVVKARALEERALQYWVRHFVDGENAHIDRLRIGTWVEAWSNTIRVGSPLVVLLLGTRQVMDGSLQLGSMLALNALAVGVFLPLGNLVQSALRINVLRSHAERLEDIFRSAPEPRYKPTSARPLSGEVQLKGVHFRYSPLSPFELQDVSFHCRQGELIALVGKTGSGKSTLAKLIASLYPPGSGHVLYDGRPLEEWGLEPLRTQIGYVPQTPRFFGTQSVRLNIAGLDSSVPLARVEGAAKAAAIDEEIRMLPMGYDTLMINDGGSFSGGQRQRIALASAFLRAPRILILDEATSALDAPTEGLIYQALLSLSCTRIVIAHRLSTIRNADRIVVVDQGQIADQGNHDELFARCELYRSLLQGQTGVEPA